MNLCQLLWMNIMSKSSQATPPNHSDDEFVPASFVIFCLDSEGSVAFEASWGNSTAEIKKFAGLVKKINNGEFENLIIEQLKEQSKENTKSSKNYTTFNKYYSQLNGSSLSDLVIDPTEVELN